jgi:hypothetical protein
MLSFGCNRNESPLDLTIVPLAPSAVRDHALALAKIKAAELGYDVAAMNVMYEEDSPIVRQALADSPGIVDPRFGGPTEPYRAVYVYPASMTIRDGALWVFVSPDGERVVGWSPKARR